MLQVRLVSAVDATIDARAPFRVKCPRCAGKADGIMSHDGARVTYREIYGGGHTEPWVRGTQVRRVLCSDCRLVKTARDGQDYKLWYRTTFKGHTLWACNEAHIESLIEVLGSGRSMTGTPYEGLPKWMVTDREKVIGALRRLSSR